MSLGEGTGKRSPARSSPLSLGSELPTSSQVLLRSCSSRPWPQAAYSRVGEPAYSGCTRRQPISPQREPHSPIVALSLVKVTLGGSICLSLVLLSQLDQNVGADAGALFISSSWHASLVMYLKTWPMLHSRFCSDAFGGKQTARLKVARTIRGLFSHVGRILQADLLPASWSWIHSRP